MGKARVVQYTRSVAGRQTSDGSWRILTTCHRLSVRNISAIKRHPPHLHEYLWRHYVRMRNIVTHLLPAYLCCLWVIATCHKPSTPLTTHYWSGVLDSMGNSYIKRMGVLIKNFEVAWNVFFLPLRGTYSKPTRFILLFFWLNTLQVPQSKAPAVDLLRLKTLKNAKTAFLTPERYYSTPVLLGVLPPFPLGTCCSLLVSSVFVYTEDCNILFQNLLVDIRVVFTSDTAKLFRLLQQCQERALTIISSFGKN